MQKQKEQDLMMGKQKEVEEWLLGSGESAETEASIKNKINMPLFKIIEGDQKE